MGIKHICIVVIIIIHCHHLLTMGHGAMEQVMEMGRCKSTASAYGKVAVMQHAYSINFSFVSF